MSDETTPDSEVRAGQRIAKVMARAGLCSRRDAEAWIAAGRVSVNGKVLDSPAYNVSEADDVRVDGKPLAARERTRLFLFHKPRGLVTTARDPEGRATVFDALPPDLPRLVAVGRLDINTEGLLLLTNDGGLARTLELPSTGWLRRYRVRAHGRVDQAKLDSLSDGVTIDGIVYAGIEARLDREQGSNAWITMGLREGKKHEIKHVLEHLGLSVNRLIRVSFGPFELGDLAEGEVAEVRTRVLRQQLGPKLAREAGVDFDAPILERPQPETASREQRRGRRETQPRGCSHGAERERHRAPASQGERNAPRNHNPRPSSAPERRRKHISAVRADIVAEARGPRKRIERGATQDRKGRTIAVERRSPAGAQLAAANGLRPNKVKGRTPGLRHSTSFESKREAPERPRRPDAFEAKRAPDGEGRARRPRAAHKGGGERPSAGPRRPAGERRGARPDQAGDGRPGAARGKGQMGGRRRPVRGGRPPHKGPPTGAGGGKRPPRRKQ